ncbi:MAG: 2-amino-4-hydroxy-6-hydroxymethyldihydropteridine diphosphokinase [Deltaproteobacteria bacterium]|nr:2-amino-4-hydroxy-6-hydroxymethyldihydropteridine diphosphokinase [Deltaproteobacteria bacterium]
MPTHPHSGSTYVLGLGANLGDRFASLRQACLLLDASEDLRVVAESPVYETDPVGPPQPRYLNAAIRVETTRSPESLLDLALATEARMGRDRRESVRWGPRIIDIDLLYAFHKTLSSPRLQLPHAHLLERSFALAPLLDVAPELRECFGDTLAQLGGTPKTHAPTLRGARED